MKIDGVVVLYQPSEINIKHIAEYAGILHSLFVVDNSERVNKELLKPLLDFPNVKYIPMNGNQGIASALRIGAEKAIADQADFCLTMDQDSIFPVDKMDDIRKYLSIDNINEYGIIALRTWETDDQQKGLQERKLVITSGNFINLENYCKISGFREELFIDSVDFDLCHQFYQIDKKIAIINEIALKHMIGAPETRKFFFRNVISTNHSPIRCYYRHRNNYVLYREDKAFYSEIKRADFKHIIKIIFYEKNKREKLRMIRLGVKHAKKGILGKLQLEKEAK